MAQVLVPHTRQTSSRGPDTGQILVRLRTAELSEQPFQILVPQRDRRHASYQSRLEWIACAVIGAGGP